jgi:hypothetical protein
VLYSMDTIKFITTRRSVTFYSRYISLIFSHFSFSFRVFPSQTFLAFQSHHLHAFRNQIRSFRLV